MELFNYLLKVSACSALFFAFYLLVLRKLTFFKINRFYLLASLLVSFIIPAMQFTIKREVEVPKEEVSSPIVSESLSNNETIIQTAPTLDSIQANATGNFNWLALLPYLYGGIVAFLLLLALWRIVVLLKHTKVPVKEINGLKLVAKRSGFTNCSFFNYVFIDENSLTETELAVLLAHEEVHAKQYHSIDKLLMMVTKAILWLNPIVYLYDKALEQSHEYEADETTSENFGTDVYAALLLKLAVSKSSSSLIHNFVKSPIKERIKMLFSSKSKNMKKLVYLLVLPIGLGLIWGFTVDIVKVFPNQEKEFTLVIDAGHGGKDKGAVVNGVSEKEIALSMSKKLKALAEEKGIKVITTRANDTEVSLKERAATNGSFLISLHVNSEPKGTALNGVEMFIPKISDQLKSLRSGGMTYHLYKSLKNVNGIAILNKPKQMSLYILKNTKLPSVVLELGYLTNKKDFQFITNEQKQNELVKAIIDGVLNYKKYNKTDDEMKAMIEDSKRISDRYLAWQKSDKYKSIVAKATKIKNQTIQGKIESLHYFSKKVDGFILNANGERYRVYLIKAQLKEINLGVGDPISVKVNQVETWYDSDYPVIKTPEILSMNKVSIAPVKVYSKPTVLRADSMNVNNLTQITKLKSATIKIFNGKLEAEEVEIDTKMEIITARKAKFENKKGEVIESDLMIFDARKEKLTVNVATGYVRPQLGIFN